MTTTGAVRRLTAAAMATVTWAACGSSAKDTIPLAVYQHRANAICGPAVEAMNDFIQPAIEATLAQLGPEPFDVSELQRFYRALSEPTHAAGEVIDDMLEALAGLPQPDAHADQFEQLWSDIDTTMDKARADIADATKDPGAAVDLWNIETSPFTAIDARAGELGVPQCGINR